MRSGKSFLLLCAALTWAGKAVSAQDQPPPVQMRVSLPAPNTVHAFGGRPLAFDLEVQAPLGSRLKIYADLLQTANGSVATTLRRDVPVSPELVFTDRTTLTASCRLPDLDAVKRTTPMLLRLRTDLAAAKPGDGLLLPVSVHPPEEPDAWKKTLSAWLTHGGLRRLAVFGESRVIRDFLRARKVAFDDLGSDWPAEPAPGSLYVTELPASALAARQPGETRGTRWLIFTTPEATSLPAGVYQRIDAAGASGCKVMLPDLFNHPEDHPEKLESLGEIFRLALEWRPTSSSDDPP